MLPRNGGHHVIGGGGGRAVGEAEDAHARGERGGGEGGQRGGGRRVLHAVVRVDLQLSSEHRGQGD